jgi:hypothetical protein
MCLYILVYGRQSLQMGIPRRSLETREQDLRTSPPNPPNPLVPRLCLGTLLPRLCLVCLYILVYGRQSLQMGIPRRSLGTREKGG